MKDIKRYITLGIGVGFVLSSMMASLVDPEPKHGPVPLTTVLPSGEVPPRSVDAPALQTSPALKAAPTGGASSAPDAPPAGSREIREYDVFIPAGVSAGEIADILKDAGVISSTDEFLRMIGENGASRLKDGRFKFREGERLESVVNQLTGG